MADLYKDIISGTDSIATKVNADGAFFVAADYDETGDASPITVGQENVYLHFAPGATLTKQLTCSETHVTLHVEPGATLGDVELQGPYNKVRIDPGGLISQLSATVLTGVAGVQVQGLGRGSKINLVATDVSDHDDFRLEMMGLDSSTNQTLNGERVQAICCTIAGNGAILPGLSRREHYYRGCIFTEGAGQRIFGRMERSRLSANTFIAASSRGLYADGTTFDNNMVNALLVDGLTTTVAAELKASNNDNHLYGCILRGPVGGSSLGYTDAGTGNRWTHILNPTS